MSAGYKRYYYTGMAGYFLSGICAISVSIIVSLLQDHYGLSYGFMGTMVSAMSVGNMISILTAGVLPEKTGERFTTLLLGSGYFLGYLLISITGQPAVILLSFILIGIARGLCTNKCTVLVGNHTDNRARGIALQNSWWSAGSLLSPFLIAFFAKLGEMGKTSFLAQAAGLALLGLLLWLLFLRAGLPKGTFEEAEQKESDTGYEFLKQPLFWLLTLLIFCSMGVEHGVNGWMVSYYKSEKILSGVLSTYTVTIQWVAILASRLLTAYVFRPKRIFRFISIMGGIVLCPYLVLVMVRNPLPAILALMVYSFAVGGIFPTAVAGIGELMNSRSIGVMLSISSVSAILFPWLIGIAADNFGLRAGMMVILAPAAGMVLLSLYMNRRTRS